jgi:hypothetical protein
MIELVIEERWRSIGPFKVGRVLPFAKRRMVGPFIFLDHMGPVELPKGVSRDTDVRPHPHIGLATVTYLSHQRPGDGLYRVPARHVRPNEPRRREETRSGRTVTRY